MVLIAIGVIVMEEHNYYIYCYTNTINNKKYIGQTKQSKEIRSGVNGWKYQGCPRFWSAIQKYGWDNFSYTVLKTNLTLDEANYWEQYYISIYHTWIDDPLCQGYNLSKGGFNKVHTQETIEKMRESHKKENLSKETLKRMSDSAKKKYIEHPELKEKIKQLNLGKKLSEEQRKKMSDSQKKRFQNPEERKKRSELSKKKVRCIELNTIYDSIQEAAKAVGLASGGDIGRVCNKKGSRKTAGGYHWEFVNKEVTK